VILRGHGPPHHLLPGLERRRCGPMCLMRAPRIPQPLSSKGSAQPWRELGLCGHCLRLEVVIIATFDNHDFEL